MRETEEACRRDPTFMPLAEWQARFKSGALTR
jgi:catechol 2,3-dioxygenase